MNNSVALIWRGRGPLLIAVLSPFALLFGLIVCMRLIFYRLGIFRSRRLKCAVVSVGNISVGGTGKTPITAEIVNRLIAGGRRTAILSRGYGGSRSASGALVSDGSRLLGDASEFGDEPVLLSRICPGAIIAIGADRYRTAIERLIPLDVEVIILDDAFSHLQLSRDFDLLLIDGEEGLGRGGMLPAGPMREPLSSIGRADMVLFTKRKPSEKIIAAISKRARRLAPEHAKYAIDGLYRIGDGEDVSFEQLAEGGGVAYAGIAQPGSFFDMLAERGAAPAATFEYPDHRRLSAAELESISEAAKSTGVRFIVTTEKDAVKLTKENIGENWLAARLGVEIGKQSLEMIVSEIERIIERKKKAGKDK